MTYHLLIYRFTTNILTTNIPFLVSEYLVRFKDFSEKISEFMPIDYRIKFENIFLFLIYRMF